ncbi:TadE/TadG family type IV pilus assembly protein [Nocardioides sp. YIM 152588]|uniref:TadE family protein n=1 Tax=Nocardioides sp. YIM 152588 TaxID=3158259 RepID=UPI0032E4B915
MVRPRVARARAGRPRRPGRRGDRGAAAVEFALVLPVLLYLIFGIIDFGVALSFRQSVSQAAAEGARAAAVQIDPGLRELDAFAAVEGAMAASGKTCASDGMTCTMLLAPASCATCVEVTVSYDYGEHPLIPSVPGFGVLFDTIEHSAVIRVS